MSVFLAEQSLPFSVALILMIALSVIEGLSLLFGSSGLSATLDSALDLDLDADIDIDAGAGAGSAASGLLSWLHVGKVPVLILLILFLTSFGLAGIVIQMIARGFFGDFLSVWIASAGAFLVTIPSLRLGGSVLEKILPKDESSAVSLNALIGRAGVIVIGTARVGVAAQARVRDVHGLSHYVMVEPDQENEVFETGTEILLVKRIDAKYQAIRNPHAEWVQP